MGQKGTMVFWSFHYNHLIQLLIYRLLLEKLAGSLHKEGFPCEKRHFKLFTFSRLLERGQKRERNGRMGLHFPARFSFFFVTPREEILESLWHEALVRRSIEVLGQEIFLVEVQVIPEPQWPSSLMLRFLSPVTVYRTSKENGKRITHFLSSSAHEFNRLLVENAWKSYFLLTGKTAGSPSFSLYPFRFSEERNRAVILFKRIPIVAWTGIFWIEGAPELIAVTHQTGLGGKNSAGSGMWEVWEPSRHGDVSTET